MPYQQFTRAQLRAYAYERVADIASFYRNDEINRYINQALRIWNVLAGFWRGQSATDPGLTVAHQVYYSVPAAFAYIYRVSISGQQQPLGSSSLWDLDYGQPTWESDIAGIGNAPSEITAWAPAALNLFALWPASAAGGEGILLEGVLKAPVLTDDSQFVDIGRDDLEHILDYIEHLCTFKQGGQEFQAGQELMKSFLKGAAAKNALLMQSSKFRSWMGLSDQKKRPMRVADEKVGAR